MLTTTGSNSWLVSASADVKPAVAIHEGVANKRLKLLSFNISSYAIATVTVGWGTGGTIEKTILSMAFVATSPANIQKLLQPVVCPTGKQLIIESSADSIVNYTIEGEIVD